MKNKLNSLLISLLLIIGLFFPTSLHGVILLKKFTYIQYGILLLILLALALNNKKAKLGFWFAFSINFILLFFTLITPMFYNSISRIAFGSYFPYFSLSLIFFIYFKEIKASLNKIFIVINIITITIGLLIIYKTSMIENLLLNYYSTSYDGLVSTMLFYKKPIDTFGTHSLSSFFYYLFFYMSFKTYANNKNKLYFLLTLGDLFLIFNLKSVSAYIFLAIGLLQLILYLIKRSKYFAFITIPAIFLLILKLLDLSKNNLSITFGSTTNGFNGRFSQTSPLTPTFNFISTHLLPIGITTVNGLYYTDSGFVDNFLKGSVFLVITIYLGLFVLLKNNIRDKRTAYWLFFIILFFEIGYPSLTYARTLYLLPFILVYLNNLKKQPIKES